MTSAQVQAIDPHVNQLGDDNSIWFKLSALARGENANPMPIPSSADPT